MKSQSFAVTTTTKIAACTLLIAITLAIALLASSRAYAQQSCTQVKMIFSEAYNTLYMVDGAGNRLRDIRSGNTLSNRQVNSFIVVRGIPSRIGVEIEGTGAKSYRSRSNVTQDGDIGYEDDVDNDYNDAVILLTPVSCPRVSPPRRAPPPRYVPPPSTPPSVSSVSADSITKTTARAVVNIADHDGTELTVKLRYQERAEAQDWPNAHTDTAIGSASPATQNLENLTPGTEYVLQASFDAAFPDEGTKEHTFTTEHPPSISSVRVGDIEQTSARATIDIANSDGSAQTVKLQYREKDATPVEEWNARPVQAESSTGAAESSTGATASIDLSGLTADTRYEVQAWLGSDETVKVSAEFRTLPPDPSLSGVNIGSITQNSAVATASIADSDGSAQTVKLQYREKDATPVEEWNARPVQTETSTGATASIDLSGLTADTRYEVQAWLASDETGKTAAEFRTLQAPPQQQRAAPSTLPDPRLSGVRVSSITRTSAVATVSITDAGSAQKTAYMSLRKSGDTEWSDARPKTTSGASVTYDLTALEPGTSYEVKAYLKTDPDTSESAVFTTLAPAPSVSGISFGSITQIEAVATVNIANAGSAQKTVHLRYRVKGATIWTTESSQDTEGASTAFSLDGLTAGTTYEVQAWLNSTTPSAGTTIYTFDTLVIPPSISNLRFEDIDQTTATAVVEISHAGTEMKKVFLKHSIPGDDDWTILLPTITYGDDTPIYLNRLKAGTTYEVVVALSDDFGDMATNLLTTLPSGPRLSGVTVGEITQTSAVATVTIANPGIERKTAQLRYRKSGESEWSAAQRKTTTGASATFNLTRLESGTIYQVQASLNGNSGTSKYAVFTTLMPGSGEFGVSVVSITQTSAVARVTIPNPGAGQKTVQLQYHELGESEWGETQRKTITGSSATFNLTGLESGTTYQVRASLSDDSVTPKYAVFTTLVSDPSVSGISIGEITQTSAVATVNISNPGTSQNMVYLHYRESGESESGEIEWSATDAEATGGASITFDLTGLTPETKYEVEASLSSAFSGTKAATFTTLPSGPVVSGISVEDIEQTSARAEIEIANSNDEEQTVRLRYRTTTPQGKWSDTQQATSSTDSASIDMSSLTPGTEYEVQASLGVSFPAERTKHATFTTWREPSIASVEAKNIGRNGATIRATIADSHGFVQTVYVRHRTTTPQGEWSDTQQADSVNDVASVQLTSLSSETEYVAEASLDDSFPSGERKSVTFTTTTTLIKDSDGGISGGSGITQAASAANTPLLGFSPQMLTFTAVEGGDNPPAQTFSVWNRAQGAMNFTLSDREEWLSQQPVSGVSNGPDDAATITVSVDSSGLAPGQYVDAIGIEVSRSGKVSGQVNVVLDVLPSDYIRQFVSRAEGGVVMLPDGTVKIVVPPLAPPKDVDIELMKLSLQAHGLPPGEQERVVVAIDSNTYPPGGDTPEDVAYSPYVELWIMLPDGESTACAEGKAKVYSVVSGDWIPVEHRCETDESGNLWAVSEIERLGAFTLVIDDSPVTPTPIPAVTPTTVLTVPQGTAVQRTSLPAQPPTPTPTQAPTPLPIPNGKTVAASVSFIPTPTPTAVPSSTQGSIPVLQASTVAQSSGGFNWMILAALGVLLLIGAFIVFFLVYRDRRRRYIG